MQSALYRSLRRVQNPLQESGGYRVTLLGSVAGKNLSDCLAWDDAGLPKDDRLYTVVAIEHADGTPMPPAFIQGQLKQGVYPLIFRVPA